MSFPILGSAIAGGGRTYPSVRGSVQGSFQNSGGTFVPTIPTHSAGNLILVFVAYERDDSVDGVAATVSASGGWTERAQQVNAETNHNVTGRGGIALYSRLATTSSHTITITNSNNSGASANVYVLQGATSVEANVTAGNDPASLTASWGIDFNYWLAAEESCSTAPGIGPSGFGNSVQTTGKDASITTLDKNEAVATQDPSAFNAPANADRCCTITAVVRP